MGGLDVKSRAQVFASARSQSRSVSPKKRPPPSRGGGQDGYRDGYWADDQDINGNEYDCDSCDEPLRERPRKRSWDTSEHDDGQVPGFSCSSATQSSFASGSGSRVSRPLTPREGDTAASSEAAGRAPGSQRPQKRIHVEENPSMSSWTSD